MFARIVANAFATAATPMLGGVNRRFPAVCVYSLRK
jgi:hypothetical protein